MLNTFTQILYTSIISRYLNFECFHVMLLYVSTPLHLGSQYFTFHSTNFFCRFRLLMQNINHLINSVVLLWVKEPSSMSSSGGISSTVTSLKVIDAYIIMHHSFQISWIINIILKCADLHIDYFYFWHLKYNFSLMLLYFNLSKIINARLFAY